MSANASMVIILQYRNVSNQHIAHLKLTQCYVSVIFQLKNPSITVWGRKWGQRIRILYNESTLQITASENRFERGYILGGI